MERWEQRISRSEFKGIDNANASFKGIPFILKTSRVTFGRRLLAHEYPLQDKPFTEDLGRRVRIFTISGSVLGSNYLSERDSLVNVCERKGPGDLINPFFGNISAICEEIKFEDTITNIRESNFEAIFIETGELTFPLTTPDTAGAVELATNISIKSLKNEFESAYLLLSKPLVFTAEVLRTLENAIDSIGKAKGNIGPKFRRDLLEITLLAKGIVTSAEEVYDSIVHLITFGIFDNENFDESLSMRDSFNGLKTLLNFSEEPNPISESSTAISLLVQKAAAITMGLSTSRIDFTSATEAREFRNLLLLKIDDLIFKGTSDEVTQELNNLRTVIVQDIDTRSINLPELKTISLKMTGPAIVLSQTLYGNKDKGSEIVSRNKIEHPGFLPGGEELEVLLNVQ